MQPSQKRITVLAVISISVIALLVIYIYVPKNADQKEPDAPNSVQSRPLSSIGKDEKFSQSTQPLGPKEEGQPSEVTGNYDTQVKQRLARLATFEDEVISLQKENDVFWSIDGKWSNANNNFERLFESSGLDWDVFSAMRDKEKKQMVANSEELHQNIVKWLDDLGEREIYWDSIYTSDSPESLLSPVFSYPMNSMPMNTPNNHLNGRVRFIDENEYKDFAGLELAIMYSTTSSHPYLVDWMISRRNRSELKTVDVMAVSIFSRFSRMDVDTNPALSRLNELFNARNPAYRLVAYKAAPVLTNSESQLIEYYRKAAAEADPIFWKVAIDGLGKMESQEAKVLLEQVSDKYDPSLTAKP